METLESSRVCRLCGKQSGISINIFDKNENHVKKINAVLPIMVHEMDLLPKHMCHRCSYKLEEFHKFYVECLKTDADLKSQLSWMRKEDPGERVGVPMVHIENIKIKVEPPDFDAYDMNAMVDNVDYVNSMNSVTFPVNGIRSKDISKGLTYTAYARCGCYCDKADQSNQTVSANFNNRTPRCSRINNVETGNKGCLGKSQAVRTNFLSNKPLQEPTSLVTFVDKATFNLSPSRKKFVNANEKSPRPTIVRNLRPRRSSGNYVGTKRKKSTVTLPNNVNKSKNAQREEVMAASTTLDTTEIKVEKVDEIAGRILRPRIRTIDYTDPKRKYSRSIGKNQRSQGDKYRLNKTVVSNISNKLKLPFAETRKPVEDKLNLTIKEEQVSDFEDSMHDESVPTPTVGDLISRIDTLSNDRVADVKKDPFNSSTFPARYTNRKRSIVNKLKSLNTPKSELQSRKISSKRTAAINHSSKYLRSQNVHLRNGKIRKFDSPDNSAIKLRRSVRNLSERGKTSSRAFLTAIRKTVKKLPVSINAIDNIKHYCEECNTSFANKELFKLHPCYGH